MTARLRHQWPDRLPIGKTGHVYCVNCGEMAVLNRHGARNVWMYGDKHDRFYCPENVTPLWFAKQNAAVAAALEGVPQWTG